MGSVASKRFTGLMVYVDQLIDIHAKLKSGKGRRHHQEALHRAGVVMVLAAWEAYIEELVTEAHELILGAAGIDLSPTDTNAPPAWSRPLLITKRNGLKQAIGQMHAPNWQNLQRLCIDWLGFDPTDKWQWTWRGGTWDKGVLRDYLNTWLRIRHCVAHGADLPMNIPMLKGANGKPRLILWHLKDCKGTFMHLVRITDEAVSEELVGLHGLAKPW